MAFANPDSEELVDAIPMFELEEIRNMTCADDNGPSETAQGDANEVRFSHAFALCSTANGYNSGRKYIMLARTEGECTAIIDDLNKKSRVALDKFLGKTEFCKMQVLPASHCAAHTLTVPYTTAALI